MNKTKAITNVSLSNFLLLFTLLEPIHNP